MEVTVTLEGSMFPRDHHPVMKVACPDGINARIVSRYEDVAVLRDPRFSARGTGESTAGGVVTPTLQTVSA
ncbi:hypothetical protein GCM10029964_034130 [Kibdelosporangium lantanae]